MKLQADYAKSAYETFVAESKKISELYADFAKQTFKPFEGLIAKMTPANRHERFEIKRINHQEAYSLDGACTNMAEEYFSPLRRAEIGIHHHIAGAYVLRSRKRVPGGKLAAASLTTIR
jgi:hypothetical protein